MDAIDGFLLCVLTYRWIVLMDAIDEWYFNRWRVSMGVIGIGRKGRFAFLTSFGLFLYFLVG